MYDSDYGNQMDLGIWGDGDISDRLMVLSVDERKSVKMGIKDLFDSSRFNSIKMVSFAASPDFFYRYISDFNDVELIIGIEDSEKNKSFVINLLKNYYAAGIDFFEQCTDEMRDHIADGKIRIRFSETGCVFHNKMYLMSGTAGQRIMWGSSNLSSNGFGLGKQQYEDLSFSEELSIYHIFEKRYNFLKEKTIDFIPQECKQLWKVERRLPNYNEQSKILIDYIDENRNQLAIDTEDYRDVKELAKQNKDKEVEIAKRVVEEISQLTDNAKNKKRNIKSHEEITSPTIYVTRSKSSLSEESERKYLRTELIYQEDNNQIFTFKPGLDESQSVSFGKKLSAPEIKDSIILIDKLVSIYKSHSVDGELENSKKAYEILLHAFMAPFMWKVRKDYIEEHSSSGLSIGGDIPNILVINGTAECGKSAMIAALNSMTQNGAYEIPQWKQYLSVDKYALDKTVHENNIYPLIIDEIEKDFLGGGNCSYKGEAWIKSIANTLGKEEHPYIITATNKSIDLSAPLRRRVNYISFGSKIDRTMQSDAREKFSSIINVSNADLFEDFCGRVLEKIENGVSLYDSNRMKNGIKDPIAIARDIFMEYYMVSGIEVPEYFPMEPFDDYSSMGKQMWKDTFLDPNCKEAFIYQKNTNEIIVNTEKLSSKMYDKKSAKLSAYLNEYVKSQGNLVESSYIHLDAEKFFAWIDIENPYVRKGFLTKILKNRAI